jgi:hypothetical protein
VTKAADNGDTKGSKRPMETADAHAERVATKRLRVVSPPEAGTYQHLASRRRSLANALTQLASEIALAAQHEEGTSATEAPAVARSASSLKAAALPPVDVVIGTSEMARADPELVNKITTMVNSSYFASLREVLPEGMEGYERVSTDDVVERLGMGDAGARANRVLHLAFRAGELVGCCSSTFQPPWTDQGCGHWGLLVVSQAAQGTGVASAIVAAAERRLAGCCTRVQIEYDYYPDHPPSQALKAMYEDHFGFVRESGSGRRRSSSGGSEFRRCHKELTEALRRKQRPVYLRAMRESLATELAELAAAQPGGIDRLGSVYLLKGLAGHSDAQHDARLAALNGRSVYLVWFDHDDARYIVRLLSHSLSGDGSGDGSGDSGGGGGEGESLMMSVDLEHLEPHLGPDAPALREEALREEALGEEALGEEALRGGGPRGGGPRGGGGGAGPEADDGC